MENEFTPRLVRPVDLVAESLETMANRKPPSRKDEADLLRRQAQHLRESSNPKRVWILEENRQTRIE
jgi:hypothetical protein